MIRAASRPAEGKGYMYRCRGEKKEKGVQHRRSFPPSLVHSVCAPRLELIRPDRKSLHPIPSHRQTVRPRALEPLRTLLSRTVPTPDRAASAVAGVRAGGRRLSVPSVENEIRGSTARRGNRSECECEIVCQCKTKLIMYRLLPVPARRVSNQ
jgi:hypothetical protein